MKDAENIPICSDCLKFNTIFDRLEKDDLEEISYEKGCNFYKRGDTVYHEGNRVTGIYCVNKGIIKLYKTGVDGKEQIIRFSKQGDIIGYRSILSGELACTTAKVVENAVLCFIPASQLLRLVKENSDFAMKIMQLSCKELGEANKFILDIAQKTVRERLAEILLLLEDTFDLDNDNILQISLTREEIANLVGTATESVIRLLSEFKSDKYIELHGRKIKILNKKALERIANAF